MKRFLSDYGFAILAAIVVIVLVTFSSSVSSAIQKQTANTIQSLGKVANNDLNKIDDSVSLIDLTSINKSGVTGDFSRKGNLVTISGTQYRVLEVNRTQVKVVMMENYTKTIFGDRGWQKYADSDLDQIMTEYYNSLPTAIQNAIVEQNISQSMYSWSSGTNASADFSAWFKNSFTDATTSGTNYYLTKIAEVNVGARKIFALDVDDVINYLGLNSTPQDVNELFFGVRSNVGRYVWLRSADSNNGVIAFYVRGDWGSLEGRNCNGFHEARPAFVLDLSLLS